MDTQDFELPAPEARASEGAKRRQIIDGARRIFLRAGFDAASMGAIAREAGVSKGTLYVYFKSKEELFEAIVEEQCGQQGEQIFTFDANDRDVEAVLTRLGDAFVRFMCLPRRRLLAAHRHRHCRPHAGARREVLSVGPCARDRHAQRSISRARWRPAC